MRTFFPESTRYETEIRVLSGKRLELQEKLGRFPGPEENQLELHRVFAGQQEVGAVMTRRVKGEHGAVELVLAVDAHQRIRALRLQRLREPEEIARALESAAWLGTFIGKDAEADWQIGMSSPDLPAGARASGLSIVEGVRSLLAMLAISSGGGPSPSSPAHHHQYGTNFPKPRSGNFDEPIDWKARDTRA